jgi:hypothetical protein
MSSISAMCSAVGRFSGMWSWSGNMSWSLFNWID